MYFDIFRFNDIFEKLGIDKENLDIDKDMANSAKKFSFAVYFNNELEVDLDKVFYTISGYIKNNNSIDLHDTKSFREFESFFKNEIKKFFEFDFNKGMGKLIEKYGKFNYEFLGNLENVSNLHSFFVEDLLKAMEMKTSDNLNRYFEGFSHEKRINLDSDKESSNFNLETIKEILQPKNYPMGRFPSNPKYMLSLMQQVAVNLALNDENNMRSVNGPPGTGKTTLLKDIFADLIVRAAKEIVDLDSKIIKGDKNYFKQGKIGRLPESISKNNIIVASSNNGAVQNIVNELPLIKDVFEDFKEGLFEVDYFKDIMNEGKKKKEGKEEDKKEEKFWGLFSLEGGKSENCGTLREKIKSVIKLLKDEEFQGNEDIYDRFNEKYEEVKKIIDDTQFYSEHIKEKDQPRDERERNKNLIKLDNESILSQIGIQESMILKEKETLSNLKSINLGVMTKLFNRNKVKALEGEISKVSNKLEKMNSQIEEAKKQLEENEEKIKRIEREVEEVKKNKLETLVRLNKIKEALDPKPLDPSLDYDDFQLSNPWFDDDFRIKQVELFTLALGVRKQFLYENIKNVSATFNILNRENDYLDDKDLIERAHEWMNFIIPVISTTFASFASMFRNVGVNKISNLFIDEAGQAIPQAAVGGIFRSKRVMAVGDPAQIKPVLTLDSHVLKLVAEKFGVSEKFVSMDSSCQSLIDDTSQYGYYKSEDEWIGIPLWVHRRCNYPMFNISNEISYNGLMVQGIKADGKAEFFDIKGKAIDKFVKEQAEFLKEQIKEKSRVLEKKAEEEGKENYDYRSDIYIISPFRNISLKLGAYLKKELGFTLYDKNDKAINVGTVHTFQGKEAKVVYLVLGCDSNSKGAAAWAITEPNIMNVAATRAKKEFYVIGDKELYEGLNAEVIIKTIFEIDKFNGK